MVKHITYGIYFLLFVSPTYISFATNLGEIKKCINQLILVYLKCYMIISKMFPNTQKEFVFSYLALVETIFNGVTSMVVWYMFKS